MPEVLVAAGSNVRPREHLRRAVAMMREAWPDLRLSGAYRNKAVGFEGKDFINLVAGFLTEQSLAEVLAELHRIEGACGRPREAPKWAPRSMDLDVLVYGDSVGEFPGAVLPRKDLLRRPYMLRPAAEVAPTFVHPTEGRTLGELWAGFNSEGHEMWPASLEGED